MHVYFDGFSICENKVVVVTAVVGVVVVSIRGKANETQKSRSHNLTRL